MISILWGIKIKAYENADKKHAFNGKLFGFSVSELILIKNNRILDKERSKYTIRPCAQCTSFKIIQSPNRSQATPSSFRWRAPKINERTDGVTRSLFMMEASRVGFTTESGAWCIAHYGSSKSLIIFLDRTRLGSSDCGLPLLLFGIVLKAATRPSGFNLRMAGISPISTEIEWLIAKSHQGMSVNCDGEF